MIAACMASARQRLAIVVTPPLERAVVDAAPATGGACPGPPPGWVFGDPPGLEFMCPSCWRRFRVQCKQQNAQKCSL